MKANQWTSLPDRVWPRVEKTDGCWNWIGPLTRTGYGRIRNRGQDTRVHRVVWEMLFGRITDGSHVLHSCDNRRCVRPDHLRLGTPRDNFNDMIERDRYRGGFTQAARDNAARGDRHGTHTKPESVRRGEQSSLAKLTDEKVREIRRRRAAGETVVALGQAFGVSHVAISAICNRRTWRHVDLSDG